MFFVLLIIVVFLKCVSYVWEKRRLITLYRALKNDIKEYPIIGHGHLFLGTDEDRMTSFHRMGMEAIKQGGVTRLRVLHRFVAVVADAEIAEVVFRNCLEKADIMKIAQGLIGNGSIFAEIPIWRPRRKVLSPAFALKYLNQFVAIFDKNSRAMADVLDKMADQGPFSVWKYVAAFTMDSICETTLDFQVDALHNPNQPYLLAFDEYCLMMSKRICAPWLYNETFYSNLPWYRKIKKHTKYMQDFVDEIIRAKRKAMKLEEENNIENNHNDSTRRKTLLDLLITPSSASEGYTDLELREELLVITLAGTDTSATGIAFVIMMLAMHQDVQERVCEEIKFIFGSSSRSVTPEDLSNMKYLGAVIKETLRLYPPVPVIVRKADRDITLPSGLLLPKDSEILLNLFCLHRNPRHWGNNAGQFDPSRFLKPLEYPAAMTAFSYGPRNCLGYQYAMMSIKSVTSTLLRRYRILPARGSTPLRLKFDIMMKDVNNFTIRLEKII